MGNSSGSGLWQGALVRLRKSEQPEADLAPLAVRGKEHRINPYSLLPLRRHPESDDDKVFIVEDNLGTVVGEVSTEYCDRLVGSLSYSIHILEHYRGKGYATEAIELVLRHYFEDLRYQKATVVLYDHEDACVRLHEALGFRLEARLRRTAVIDHRHVDVLLFGITAEEYFSLR